MSLPLPPWRRALVLSLPVLLVLSFAWRGARGADDDAETEERREAAERHTERAWKAFASGNYDEVLARMDRVETYDPASPVPNTLRARVQERTGDYEKALEHATKGLDAHPEDRALASLVYRLLLTLGRDAEVVERAEAARAANPEDAIALGALGLAHEMRGRRKEALAAYEAAVATYRRGAPAEHVPWVATSAEHITRISPRARDDLRQDAVKLLSRQLDADPDDLEVAVMEADIWQHDRGAPSQAKALKRYRTILKANSEMAAARVGLARYFLVFYQQDQAMRELERALATNPRLVPALSLLASIHVGNGDYESAEKLIERALAVNPTDRETRAVLGALHWIRGQKDAYEALEREVLAYDPFYGHFYLTVSELVGERQRRYDDAASFARKAIEKDPDDGLAYTILGESLMNLGQTDEAREVFLEGRTRSKRYDDVRRENWLSVLEYLDTFKTLETENFVVRVHPSELEVMRHYLPALLEESWAVLTDKYGFVPDGTVRVDSFHDANDFSVRSVGVPGLPALGVCFGNVITLLGPLSRPLGSFSWSRTAWHEFAHTITLGQSRGQVPRWLTEGLSVYEEKMRRPDWGREMHKELYDRYRNDRLLRMDKINRAFRGPDIMFAYYQGGLIAEHLTETRGFDVIPKMLRAFGEDQSTEQVFRDVLGLELADYDRQFREFVGGLVGDYKMVPIWDSESMKAFEERTKAAPDDVEAWTRLGWAHLQRNQAIDAGAKLGRALQLDPEYPDAILLQGRLAEVNGRADLAGQAYERYLARGEDDLSARLFLAAQASQRGQGAEAVKHLEAAKACFPTMVGESSPYVQLAKLYTGAGRGEDAIRELESYAGVAGEDYGVRKKLLGHYKAKGDHERVVELCGEMVDISPFGASPRQPPDLELHRTYAESLTALGRAAEALRERQVQVELVSLLPEEERVEAGAVDDHLALARLLLEADRPLDALGQTSAALRLSPQHAGARILKGQAEEAAGYR